MESTVHDFYLHLNEFHISRMTHFVHLVFAFCLGAVAPALSYPETAFARPAQPCLAPLQWEGRSVEYNYDTGRNTRASVSYDAQNHRIRLLQQNKKHTPCQKYFEFIYLYNSGLLFQIEQKTKQCSKIPLTQAWDPFDIPMNSTYEDQYFIGGPGDMIEVQEWSDRKPSRKKIYPDAASGLRLSRMMLTVTKDYQRDFQAERMGNPF
ncbi:mammalian ependymin-related protein 1 isoform X2 [Salmo trutta]|uniref:mammalian ependymin-related protein 1 isoform X2 n=1 Tax=Salmo trutta TaxID=8032 RepID=UPI0011324D01|nr:mammalian ependymin-related protein 1-like isoform X2 [Salmo trutta]